MSKTEKKRAVRKEKFLEFLKDEKVLGNVTVALRKSGLKRTTMYKYRDDDAKFSDEWDKIVEESSEVLADLAENSLRKAILAGNITAIIFTLKNKRPLKWKDRKEFTGEDGGPIPVNVKMPSLENWLKKKIKNVQTDTKRG